MKKDYLLTPGPTPIPPQVYQALSKPIIHHRTPAFQEILKEAIEGLRFVFQTKNDIFIFSSSGTGAMEAAVANLLSPKDRAVVVRGGKFGERWGEICQVYGIEVIPIDVEWGKAVEPEKIREILDKQKLKAQSSKQAEAQAQAQAPIKAVFTTLCETSTGVTNDIEAIGKIVKDTASVLVVDAISGLGAVDLQTDNWSVDIVVAGSQKGLMIPPGLSFCSISPKAWKLVEDSKCPRYYFDFKGSKEALEKIDTPFTPAISLVIALNESLKIIRQEGLENIFKRHSILAKGTRQAMQALGLELFAPTASSDAVTAVKVPAGIDGEKLVKTMRDKFGVTIAGGQAELKGKVFRIAHMGYITQEDIIVAISTLELALAEAGYKFQLGAGVKAAEEVFSK